MDAVAGQISRALGSENDEEPDVNAPLCANDLSGPNKPQKLKSFASFGLAEFPDTPSKGLSVCLSLCFILIAVIVFTATIKATIDPARAKVSNTQINAIESDVKHQIRSSMKSTVKMQKKAVQQRKTDNREVKNLERQVQRLERTVRQIEAPRTEVVPERREVVIARPERESTILPLRGGGVMEERGGPEAVLVRGGERGERGVSWREEGAKHDSAARLHQRHRREQDRAGPGRARGSVGG